MKAQTFTSIVRRFTNVGPHHVTFLPARHSSLEIGGKLSASLIAWLNSSLVQRKGDLLETARVRQPSCLGADIVFRSVHVKGHHNIEKQRLFQ